MVLVLVDDYLPCYENEPFYAQTKSGSLWCSFVEKALAKLYKGYNRVTAGTIYDPWATAGDILNNLLPFPTKRS